MNLDDVLPLLARNPTATLDMAEVALCLAREEYPTVDVEGYLSELAAMAHDVQPRLKGGLSVRVQALCRYLFHEMGFRGNTQAYYDPRNSYFNEVLDRRTGIPLTLSIVAIAVGRRAGLVVEGVGLPGHFIAKAVEGSREVLFDPFHEGRLLAPRECEQLVEQVTGSSFEATPAALVAAPLQLIVVRLLTNLKAIYLRTSDFVRAMRVIERLRQLLPDDPLQQRDLGATLLHAGRPGQAVDHLEAYLKAVPDAEDEEAVRQLLRKAQGEVARWN
ncbi:MAG TPA: transglutaminase-like domain-containing protein [Gemmataceae bacterium]|nr:transglutaminase-like domain-containing protein [Gemmataceae bacterium]